MKRFPTSYRKSKNQILIYFISLGLLTISSSQYSFADTEIYGSLQYDYQYIPPQSTKQPKNDSQLSPHHNIDKTPNQKSRSSINQHDSHIGIKGEKDIGNGNAIIYQLEWGQEK